MSKSDGYSAPKNTAGGGKHPSTGSHLTSKPILQSDGGPTGYYDFDPGWNTFNDFMEHKALTQWGAFSLHLKDIGKATCRFGAKEGTTDAYDTRKIIYSGLRILSMIEGKAAVRAELERLLADKQFM